MSDDMLEELVTVVKKEGDYAFVEATSRSGCDSCGSAGTCGTSVLGGLFRKRKNYLRVIDHLNLSVGEKAVVVMEELDLVRAAFFAYIIPLLFMMVASIIASSRGYSDQAVFVSSVLALFTGFIFIRWLGKGQVKVNLLRRSSDTVENTIQFINVERK